MARALPPTPKQRSFTRQLPILTMIPLCELLSPLAYAITQKQRYNVLRKSGWLTLSVRSGLELLGHKVNLLEALCSVCLFEKIKICSMDLVAGSRNTFGNTQDRLNSKHVEMEELMVVGFGENLDRIYEV